MRFIKKIITKNKLTKKLQKIKDRLRIKGYYKDIATLSRFVYKPDEYAQLSMQINNKYHDLLVQEQAVLKQLHDLSNNAKCNKNDNNYIK